MEIRKNCLTILTGTLLALGAAAAHAVPIQLITNGGFETGTFAGWTPSSSGSAVGFAINNGTFVPSGPKGATAPISGAFDAVSSQTGPGQNNLFQQAVALPGSFTSIQFSWSDRIENFAGSFSDPNQEFRVQLLDNAGALISQVFSTNPGDTLLQPGPNNRSFDVTALLSPFAGQSVAVRFEQQDNLGFFNATIDNVSLVADVPEPGMLALMGLGLAGLGWSRKLKT